MFLPLNVANTFLADKNQWMVLVYKMLDPRSEHRVWAYTASTVTAPIDLFLCCPALVSEFGRSYFQFAQFAHATLFPAAIGCKRFKNYALFGRVTSVLAFRFIRAIGKWKYFILKTTRTALY